jgi:hypothetical protein
MAEEAKSDTPAEPAATPSGGRPASELRGVADALRNRVDLFGKTLAAVATLGTTAVGLKEIPDLFPAEGRWGTELVVAACLGLAVAALATIGVAVRLMGVARPVLLSADINDNQDLSDEERRAIRPAFEAAARRFGYTSLVGLEERERSLRSAARRAIDKEERGRRAALADEAKDEIEQALARGSMVTIRRRATDAVSGWSWAFYVAAIAGLLVFVVATDKVESDRKDPIADAKACGEARTAGATGPELDKTEFCEPKGKDATTPEAPTTDQARAQVMVKLAETYAACTELFPDDSALNCEPLRQALSTLTE